MLKTLSQILGMIRFSHTLFALPFAMLAAVMAWTAPGPNGEAVRFEWQQLAGIALCMVCARSAAMAFNRIVDRQLDAQNPRTRQRHMPAGILSVRSVTVFTFLCCIGFVASTLLFLPNPLPLYLSLPVLAFLFFYSFTKRITALAHFWLGASLMLAPLAAWIAIRGPLVIALPTDLIPALILGVAVMLWVAGFDVIYACQDFDFDVQAGLYSIPVRYGIVGALRFAAACHMGMLLALAALPFVIPLLGWIYGCGIGAVAVLLIYEHWLVRPDDLTRVNIAFFNVNALVSVGLFLVGTLDLVV